MKCRPSGLSLHFNLSPKWRERILFFSVFSYFVKGFSKAKPTHYRKLNVANKERKANIMRTGQIHANFKSLVNATTLNIFPNVLVLVSRKLHGLSPDKIFEVFFAVSQSVQTNEHNTQFLIDQS